MTNADHFLTSFSSVEKWLRGMAGTNRSAMSFSMLVEQVALRNRAVERFRIDLKEYADLKNAIVHERTDGHIIAEPNDRAVSDFSQICASLMNPPAVIPKFQASVQTRDMDESVGMAVRDMRDGSFSQLPILFNDAIAGVLTAETVTRWLAHEFENEVVSLWETKIAQVMPHTEDTDHYCFLSRTSTLLDALSKFEEFVTRGKDLDAILITADGRPNQSLLGILTLYDLPAILGELGVRRVSAT